MNTFSLSVSQQVGESKLLLQTNTIGTLYHLTHQGLYRQTGKYILRTRGLRKKIVTQSWVSMIAKEKMIIYDDTILWSQQS